MKKKLTLAVVTAGIVGTSLLSVQSVSAFWPLDLFRAEAQGQEDPGEVKLDKPSNKEKKVLKEKHQQFRKHRRARKKERLKAFAEFLGISQDELVERIKNGETPEEIAESLGKDFAEFRNEQFEKHKSKMIEAWKKEGLTDDEIAVGLEWMEIVHDKLSGDGKIGLFGGQGIFGKHLRFGKHQ